MGLAERQGRFGRQRSGATARLAKGIGAGEAKLTISPLPRGKWIKAHVLRQMWIDLCFPLRYGADADK